MHINIFLKLQCFLLFLIQIPMDEFLTSNGHIAEYTSEVYFIEYDSGEKAVLKLDDPTWPKEAVAEMAAYRASCFLDLNLVPKTTFYEQNGQVGTMKPYIKPFMDLKIKESYQKALDMVDPEEVAKIKLFNFVFGQWDCDAGNMIAFQDETGHHFALIDNGAMSYTTQVSFGEHPFVHFFPHVTFPDDGVIDFPFDQPLILPPDPTIWSEKYGHILPKERIRRLCLYDDAITFVIWQGKFWRQFHIGDPKISHFPPKFIESVQKLDLEILKSFFLNDYGVTFNEDFYENILKRRDQVINHQ